MNKEQEALDEARERQAAAVAAQEAVDAIPPTPSQEELNRAHLGIHDDARRKPKPAEEKKPAGSGQASGTQG